jgi:hypothetical protein
VSLSDHADEISRCLATCDVTGMRRIWAHAAPKAPQPKTDHEALVMIHVARTKASSLSRRLRFYSHRWLLDNGYASLLPDELKPSAERMYPRIVEGVGIAVKGMTELTRAVAPIIQASMSDAVLEAYADKKTDPDFVKARMMEARQKTKRRLLG